MEKYINISDIAGKVSEMTPGYAVQSWLRDYRVLEFMMLWETKNNADFSKDGYQLLLDKMKESLFTLTPKQWIESTKAIGITSKAGRYGGTFAHPVIACEFMMWISPRYRLMMVETFLLTEEGGGLE